MRKLCFIAVLALVSGCSFDKIAANNMVPVLRRTEAEFERSKTAKAGREAGPGLLVTLDGFVATSPENPELLEIAAQLNATFAFAFLEEDEPAWATELYEKAQSYSLRALAVRNEDLAKAVLEPVDKLPKLEPLDEDVVPAMFWLGFAWGARINLNRSDEKLLGDLGRVDRCMQAVLDKDENFFNGGPHLYFAIRYTSLTKAFGGKPDEGLKHFQAVDRITKDRYLMSKVLRAKFYSASLGMVANDATDAEIMAAPKRAWDDFYTTLKGVVEAKEDVWPEQRLPNEVAKVKALRLLRKPSEANIDQPEGVKNEFAKKKDDDE